MISLLVGLVILFGSFVLFWESQQQADDKTILRESAKIIANSLWNQDPYSPLAYLKLATKHHDLEHITVFDTNNKKFLEVAGPVHTFFDSPLKFIRFIPRVEHSTDILHKDEVIGRIEAIHHHDTIYLYLYLFLIIGFILLVSRLYTHIIKKEHFLQSIFRSAPMGINLVVDRRFYWANKKLCEITGYSMDELQGQSARMLYTSDEEFERVGIEIYGNIETHGTGETESKWQRKDGSLIDVHLRASKAELQEIENSVTFSVQDITQQKIVEHELQESEQRLHLALEGADLGTWDWDIQNESIYFSPRYFSMLGYGPTELPHTLKTWEDLLHPYDLKPVRKQLMASLSGKHPGWSLEFRLRAKDGNYLWILGRGKVVTFSQNGSPLRAAGTHLDITSHKLAKLALEKAAREWSTAMNASDDAIYLLDMERHILRANRAFCNMAGATEEDLVGRHIVDIIHPQGEEIPCPVCQAQENKCDAEIIMEDDDPDNPAGRPIKVNVKIVQDEQGQPVSILMSIHDLSSQREIENSLRQNKKKWERTFDSMSDIVTIQDRDMNIIQANKAAHEVLGAGSGDLNGQLCYKLFSGGDTPCPGCPELATLENLDSHSATIRHGKLGKIFLVSSSPILDENNEVEYLIHVAKDVTEQKRLEEQQIMFNSLIQQSNDAIYVIDLTTADILFANRKGYENLGYDRNEMVNIKFYDVVSEAKSEEGWRESLAVIKKEGFRLFETTQRRKDHSLLPVEINARIIHYNEQNFIVAVVRDISERKSAENEIYREKNKLEAVVAALESGLTFQDRNFKILYQNELHKEQHGRHVGEFCYTAYHGRDDVCPGCLLIKCFADGKIHHRETSKETDGGRIYLDVSASPFLDASGEIIGGVETVRDITDRKMLEAQVQQSQKMEAMGTLAGGIAHDFNNILAAIMGYCDMALQDTPPDNQVYQMLEHVAKGTERARDLVQQILTFSRKADQPKSPMLLQPVIKEALKLLQATIPSTIAVTSDISPKCGLVLADPVIVHQLIMNLCTNGYHAMRESGGQLSISLRPLTVGRKLADSIVELQEGSYVQLTIGDTGHGIDQSILKRIFEPYFTTKTKGDGTGLGLAVVHGIVTDLNGAIGVTSTVGNGTSFQIYLPQNIADEKEEGTTKPVAFMGEGRILLVDDEKEVTAMTSLMLSRLGYQILSFNSSNQALDAFMENLDDFELVITDQTMPELTGIDLAKRIRKIRPEMPILLISGYSEQIDAESCRAMGFSGFQRKPFKDYEICETIQGILNRTSEQMDVK